MCLAVVVSEQLGFLAKSPSTVLYLGTYINSCDFSQVPKHEMIATRLLALYAEGAN